MDAVSMSDMNPFHVSIIIPTYNRPDHISRLLDSLDMQTMSPSTYEVIVVDDGSTIDYSTVMNQQRRMKINYVKQENGGATSARNNGARHSSGQVLVFIDDDITIYPTTLQHLVDEVALREQTIALGLLMIPEEIRGQSAFADNVGRDDRQLVGEDLDFTNCMTGLLAIRTEDYHDLGGFQDPTGGWPNWDDVDFGYRAHQRGLKIVRTPEAKADHWDYATEDLASACRRWEAAGQSAPRLFRCYPELFNYISMFNDKAPISPGSDSPGMIGRKLARIVASSTPVLLFLKWSAHSLEEINPHSKMLKPLYRWIIGGYLFRGYRKGLKDMSI